MKKLALVLLALFMVTLSACSSKKETYELALVTDIGGIDDESFNQGSYEGLEKYAKEANKTIKYYQPGGEKKEDYLTQIDTAVTNGAKVVVTPGFYFQAAVYDAQSKYPDVKFIFVDSAPSNDDGATTKIAENTVSILYAEQVAGYLAGYAVVMDGYTKLGFAGGISVPAVISYGAGFVQGAAAAADKLDVDVEVRYKYTGTFNEDPAVKTLASGWYSTGTEIIFAAGGGIYKSVDAAAKETDKGKWVGVDTDQSGVSDRVVTSAMKELGNSVYDEAKKAFDGDFDGGKQIVFNIDNDGVGIPFDTSRFTNFTKEQYEEVYNELKNNTNGLRDSIKNYADLPESSEDAHLSSLETSHLKVDYQK